LVRSDRPICRGFTAAASRTVLDSGAALTKATIANSAITAMDRTRKSVGLTRDNNEDATRPSTRAEATKAEAH
ncbi:MAG TPA: hypothetical protein VK210_15745, partial [Terriglobia bacterium]|nr:hypothetical protein [Terriglobia bacterium]